MVLLVRRAGPFSLVLVMTLGCGGATGLDETQTDGDAVDEADDGETSDYPDDPDADCPGKLEPIEPIGEIVTVGTGTPTSCTEPALHDAVATINAAPEGGTLLFDCGGEHTITLTGSVFVTNTMLLDGGGLISLSGGGAVRVIELDHEVDFIAQRLTIRDGHVPAGSENESGAGLLHPWFGTLELIDVTFVNNHSASEDHDVGGGGLYAGGLTKAVISGCTFAENSGSTGGGVLSRSSNLSVIDTVFVENRATTWGEDGQYGNGGGLYIDRMWLDDPIALVVCGSVFERNHAKVHGSGLFAYVLEGGSAVFDRCTFEANDMADSPGGGTGSVYHEGEPLLLINSTFTGNSTGAHAGGLFLGGGTDAEVGNCTFVGNSTPGNAGALWAGDGNVAITNTTFAENSADYGPVIFKGQSGTVTLTNVILADNGTANEFSALACHETFVDGGGVVQWPEIKPSGNPDLPCTETALFEDPRLEPLADNGGPTSTLALPSDSPAIDMGGECSMFDQRGMPRVGACDAGAFEFQP